MPATEEKRQEFELPAKELDGIPWRALLIGTLLMPPLTLFGHLSYVIVQSARWTADTLLRPVVLPSCSSPGRRYGAASRRAWVVRWHLSLGLVLIYLMATVGTALAGECWACMSCPRSSTPRHTRETARPEWAAAGDPPGSPCRIG